MADETKNGGTFATDNSNGGTPAWASPSQAQTSDDLYAFLQLSDNSTNESQYLKITNFGFAIPSGATINGVTVQSERRRGGSWWRNPVDVQVKLVKGGTIQGNNKADTTTAWPTADTYKTYGGATDLWGLSWAVADINTSNFGMAISAQGGGLTGAGLNIDHIKITVSYTVTGGTTKEYTAYTTTVQGTTQFAAPLAPSGLQAGTPDEGSAPLSWVRNATDNTSVEIEYRALPAAFTGTPQVTGLASGTVQYVLTGLAASTDHEVRARNVGPGGNSGWSNVVAFTTATAPQPPNQPTNCVVSTPTHERIDVTWADNSADEDDFVVELDRDQAGTFVYATATKAAGSTSHTFTDAAPGNGGHSYQARVKARNATGDSAYAVSPIVVSPFQTPPAPPPEGYTLTFRSATNFPDPNTTLTFPTPTYPSSPTWRS